MKEERKKTCYKCIYCDVLMSKEEWEKHCKTKQHLKHFQETRDLFGKSLLKHTFDSNRFSKKLMIWDSEEEIWR